MKRFAKVRMNKPNTVRQHRMVYSLKPNSAQLKVNKNQTSKNELVINNQTLLFGDSLEILPTLKEQFDACITDPPYNISGYDHKKQIGWLKSNKFWTEEKQFNKINEDWDKFSNSNYEKFTEEWLKLICTLVKKNGSIIIFGTYHNIYKIGYLLEKLNKRIINSIVWYKRNAFPNITQRMLCESTEHMIWAVNNDCKNASNWVFNYEIFKKINNGKQMRNVWDIPLTPQNEKQYGKHPSQKPLRLVERLILGFTNRGNYVLDPFMGSGTIPLACMLNNRKSLSIEKDKNYYDLALKRLNEYSKNKTLTLDVFEPIIC